MFFFSLYRHRINDEELNKMTDLMICWWFITIGNNRVAPFPGHDQDCVLMQFGSNQWIHLCHVAAQPAKRRTTELVTSWSETILKLFVDSSVTLTTTNTLLPLESGRIERF